MAFDEENPELRGDYSEFLTTEKRNLKMEKLDLKRISLDYFAPTQRSKTHFFQKI